ncbi:unnamed protein product [Echinostoma caproni]|uniref:BRF1 domain-containing protein n=1 Tax=Echinostoma caproni TaxID=27848 RepID=A0A183A854_9TREM|nr:unnamed protein product [Echinostoma caproni]
MAISRTSWLWDPPEGIVQRFALSLSILRSSNLIGLNGGAPDVSIKVSNCSTMDEKRLAKKQKLEEEARNPPKKKPQRSRRARAPRKFDSRDKFEPMDEESEDKPMSSKINYEALEAIVGASTTQPIIPANPSGTVTPGPLLAATLLADGPGPSATASVPSEAPTSSNTKSGTPKTQRSTPAVRFADQPEVREVPNLHEAVAQSAVSVDKDGLEGNIVDQEDDAFEEEEDMIEEDEEEDDEVWQDGNDLW